MDGPGSDNPLADTFYTHVAPRIRTNPDVTERLLSALHGVEATGNDALGETPFESMTPFHALEAPSIGTSDYMRRISQYAFSTACQMAAVDYVKRAVDVDKALAPTSLSAFRLLITAAVLAAKDVDDIALRRAYNIGLYRPPAPVPVGGAMAERTPRNSVAGPSSRPVVIHTAPSPSADRIQTSAQDIGRTAGINCSAQPRTSQATRPLLFQSEEQAGNSQTALDEMLGIFDFSEDQHVPFEHDSGNLLNETVFDAIPGSSDVGLIPQSTPGLPIAGANRSSPAGTVQSRGLDES